LSKFPEPATALMQSPTP